MDPKTMDSLLARVGGKFKLVTLYQKRARELMRGMPPLVETEGLNSLEIVAKEILEGKVELITGEEAEKMRRELAVRESEEIAALEHRKGGPAPAAEEKKS